MRNYYSTVKVLSSVYFIYLGFYVGFNTAQVISPQVVGRAEETSTYSSSGFCTVNCQTMESNYQVSTEVGGKSVSTLPPWPLINCSILQPKFIVFCRINISVKQLVHFD